jgi:hypothetical protein
MHIVGCSCHKMMCAVPTTLLYIALLQCNPRNGGVHRGAIHGMERVTKSAAAGAAAVRSNKWS